MMIDMVPESNRIVEIEDRLGELEYGLPGLRARSERAVRYARRELEGLLEECRESRDGWAAAVRRGEALLAALDAESDERKAGPGGADERRRGDGEAGDA